MTTETISYHTFVSEISFIDPSMEDGYYAVPDSYANFDPETGDFVFVYDDDGDEAPPDNLVFLSNDHDEAYRILALRMYLDDFTSDAEVTHGCNVEIGRQDWLVMTDYEADQAWDQYLESYIDDCLDIPESVMPYFDREKWKNDARHDSRGHSLSGYDGCEEEQTTDYGTFYLFRQN